MKYRRSVPTWLDPLIWALGGPAAAARRVHRHRTTLHRWATDRRPIPPAAAAHLRALAAEIAADMQFIAPELKRREHAGEERAARSRAARRRALSSQMPRE